MSEARNERLAALVAEALEASNDSVDGERLEELCRAHPDLAVELRAAVELSPQLPKLQRAALRGDPMLGTLLADRYRIDGKLGAGAMGVVWSAQDTELDRPVAIKVLAGALTWSEDSERRFEREAEALAAIAHESVATVFDRGRLEDGSPFLVMERIEGVSLAVLLEEAEQVGAADEGTRWVARRLGGHALHEARFVRQATRWAAELAQGLEVAHAAGITHRDVKPSNVIIRRDGRAVLLDFGIAAIEGEGTLTRSDAALGTPAYMAPEALSGRVGSRAALDVYGLAATLYHMVTLRAPYAGAPSQILTALATREPTPAAQVQPGLPRDLQAILDTGLARAPKDRYATVAALRDDLEALLDLRSVSVRPLSPATRALRKVRRSKRFAGAVVALLLVGLAFAVQGALSLLADARLREGVEAWKGVPPNLTVTLYDTRRPALDEDAAWTLERLDRVVASGMDPVAAHALRGSYLLDLGRRDAAVADMDAIAERVGSDYARALADAYAALPPQASSAKELELEALPAPQEALDHYLAGYHELRQLRRDDAAELLAHPGLRDVRHARELEVLCMTRAIDRYRTRAEQALRFEAAADLVNAADRLEDDFGWRSAMSAHLTGVGLFVLQNWADTLAMAEEANLLCERSHIARQNALYAARRLGDIEAAREHASVALRLAPHYGRLHESLIRAEARAGNFEVALERLEEGRAALGSDEAYLRALILTQAAIHHAAKGEEPEARESAQRAVEAVDAADPDGERKDFGALRRMALAIQSREQGDLFRALLEHHAKSPITLSLLSNTLQYWPEQLGAKEEAELKKLIQQVHDLMAAEATLNLGATSGAEVSDTD